MLRICTTQGWFQRGVVAVCALLVLLVAPCQAEDVPGLTDPNSPLVYPPVFFGELKVRPIWMEVVSGKLSSSRDGKSWGLRDSFAMTSNPLFLDLMMRLQFSRLSLRVHYEQREFVGEHPSFVRPETANAQARLDYTGWRLGTDIEFAYWNRSRVGISADWDTYPAIFSQSIDTFVPTRIQARGIITIGGHATYNPVTSFYGVTGLLEGSMRWAVTKTTMTDLELSWGVKLPETILGAIGIKSGYRRTTLGFRDSHRDFDITFQGWFGEVVYYY